MISSDLCRFCFISRVCVIQILPLVRVQFSRRRFLSCQYKRMGESIKSLRIRLLVLGKCSWPQSPKGKRTRQTRPDVPLGDRFNQPAHVVWDKPIDLILRLAF